MFMNRSIWDDGLGEALPLLAEKYLCGCCGSILGGTNEIQRNRIVRSLVAAG